MTTTTNPDGFTSVGTYIKVSAILPATYDAVGFAAIAAGSWKEVGGVDTIGEIKMSRNTNSRKPLKSGVEVVVPGSASFDAFTIDGAIVRTDEGQALLETTLRTAAKLAFCIVYPDGGEEFGSGIVTSGGRAPGKSADDFAGMSYEIKPSGSTVIVAAP